MAPKGTSEAAALLRDLYARGESQRDVERRLGVSARMQRHVLAGSKPGTSYVGKLQSYRDTGRAERVTPREQRVRAPGRDDSGKPRTVQRTAAASAGAGRYGHRAAVTAGGAGAVEGWTFPHTPGVQRGQATVEVVQALGRAARSGQLVSVTVKLRDPATGNVHESRRVAHGQYAASLLANARASARQQGLDGRRLDSLAAGILGVIAGMFPNGSAGHLGANVIGLTLHVGAAATG